MPVFRERKAQRILTRMIRVTPPGAARPWRTARSKAIIEKMLADGISEGDLVAYIEGAAELVRRGREDPRWWSVGNLFGERTLEMWRAKIEELHAADAKVAATQRELERRQVQHDRECEQAPPPAVRDIALQRLMNTAMGAWSERWASEKDNDDAREA